MNLPPNGSLPPEPAPPQPPRLLDQVRVVLHGPQAPAAVVAAHVHWIVRYVHFHHLRHPRELGLADVRRFLAFLETKGGATAEQRTVAQQALELLYREVLNQPLEALPASPAEAAAAPSPAPQPPARPPKLLDQMSHALRTLHYSLRRNGQTHLYDVAPGEPGHVLSRPMSHELKFSPDGRLLVVAYVNRSIGLWDVDTGQLKHSRATAEEVFSLDWSPAGDVLATAGLKGTITLWDPRDLSELREQKGPQCDVPPVIRFSPDGSRILIAVGTIRPSPDRKLLVWGLSPDGGK